MPWGKAFSQPQGEHQIHEKILYRAGERKLREERVCKVNQGKFFLHKFLSVLSNLNVITKRKARVKKPAVDYADRCSDSVRGKWTFAVVRKAILRSPGAALL